MPRLHRSDRERYEAMVDRSGGPDACHPWIGAKYRKDYGHFTLPREGGKSKHIVASKWALEQSIGRPLEKGEVAEHYVCDNPPCQNLAHLQVGTHKTNAVDKVNRGRNGKHGRRLTAEKAVAIRHAVAGGMKVAAVAVEHGMTSDAIYLVVWGKTWAKAGGPITRHIERKKA